MTTRLKMICLTRIYTSNRLQRSGAGVENTGVRHEASVRHQSSREIFLSMCNKVLLETKEQILTTVY